MSKVTCLDSLDWKPTRPDIAHGVMGKLVLDGKLKVVHTLVEPGGGFSPHRDDYAHVFIILSGTGIVGIGEERFDVQAETVVQVSAGEEHFYQNTGDEDLVLLSMNILE